MVIEYVNNSPYSFITKKSFEILKEISSSNIFIPCTTRTLEQFERITLKEMGVGYKYAVVSNGGNIIVDGKPDKKWNKDLKKKIKSECPPFGLVNKHILKSNAQYNFLLESKIAEDIFLYYIIDNSAIPDFEVIALKEYFKKFNFNLSLDGKKLYLMPVFVDKSIALKRVLEEIGSYSKLLCSGDSMLDLEMLLSSDFGFVPSEGEIINSIINDGLMLPDHLVFSDEKCLMCSDEILSKVLSLTT
jgi:hydroxymethylpyrimidine pyrophosphatase-like HAD family hydrolase